MEGYNDIGYNDQPINGRGSYPMIRAFAASWDIMMAAVEVLRTFSASWSIVAVVQRTFSVSWRIRARISSLLQVSWDIGSGLERRFRMRWNIAFTPRGANSLTKTGVSARLIRHDKSSRIE